MRPHTRLVRLDELVLEAEPDIVRSCSSGPPPIEGDDSFPMVIVTPAKRVIAGRACLAAYRASGRSFIPCRVVQPEAIDALLTSIHNRILYGELPGGQLDWHLDLYAELCIYRWRSGEPAPAEGNSGSGGDQRHEHGAGGPGDEPGHDLSEAGSHPFSAGPHELQDWRAVGPFWFF